jgi:hypothetical protein
MRRLTQRVPRFSPVRLQIWLLKRFPDVTVFAAPGALEVMHYHASPEGRAAVSDKSFLVRFQWPR